MCVVNAWSHSEENDQDFSEYDEEGSADDDSSKGESDAYE